MNIGDKEKVVAVVVVCARVHASFVAMVVVVVAVVECVCGCVGVWGGVEGVPMEARGPYKVLVVHTLDNFLVHVADSQAPATGRVDDLPVHPRRVVEPLEVEVEVAGKREARAVSLAIFAVPQTLTGRRCVLQIRISERGADGGGQRRRSVCGRGSQSLTPERF